MKNSLYFLLILLTTSIFSQNIQPISKIIIDKDTNFKTVIVNTKKKAKEYLKLVKPMGNITYPYFYGNYQTKINSIGTRTYYNNFIFYDFKNTNIHNSHKLNLTTKPLEAPLFIGIQDVYHYNDGNYDLDGTYGRWWGATEFNTSNVWYRYLDFNNSVGRYNYGE